MEVEAGCWELNWKCVTKASCRLDAATEKLDYTAGKVIYSLGHYILESRAGPSRLNTARVRFEIDVWYKLIAPCVNYQVVRVTVRTLWTFYGGAPACYHY